MLRTAMIRILAIALLIAGFLSGCGVFGDASNREGDRFARPDHPKHSPSGQYSVSVASGPSQNRVDTWVVAIKDTATGAEVFHDTTAYSTRHGVGITWLSSSDQLWLLSSDIGTAHVDRQSDGTWVKTYISPDTVGDIPDEIRALGG
ncbi:hypothetical protein [Mycobacterium sp. NS-7484]|uniref:hypothetical protein n=1 Tax=Mycobacterium sp. NS-7484 TaxID=1834161 RepID=UPI001E4003A2|nr:hypothetical protein [Mycobacterium sp. NS-7484]